MKYLKNPFDSRNYKDINDLINAVSKNQLKTYNQIIVGKTILLKQAESEVTNKIISKILLVKNDGKMSTYKSMIETIKKIGEKLNTLIFDKYTETSQCFDKEIITKNYEELKKLIHKNILELYDPETDSFIHPIGNKMLTLSNVLINYAKNATNNVINNDGKFNPLLGIKFSNGDWDISACIDRLKSQLVYSLTGDCGEDLQIAIKQLITVKTTDSKNQQGSKIKKAHFKDNKRRTLSDILKGKEMTFIFTDDIDAELKKRKAKKRK